MDLSEEELWDKYKALVFSYINKFNNKYDWLDYHMFQRAGMFGFTKAINRYGDDSKKIVTCVINELKNSLNEQINEFKATETLEGIDLPYDPFAGQGGKELINRLLQESNLTPMELHVTISKFWDNENHSQIARRKELSPTRIDQIWESARKKLKFNYMGELNI